MGDFLSVPNKDKESEDNENNDVNIERFLFLSWVDFLKRKFKF